MSTASAGHEPVNRNDRFCEARTKSGRRCKNPAVTGKKVCRMHGGTAAGGIATRVTKSGIYSKRLPQRYLATFQAIYDDPNILGHTEEIAALTSRQLEIAEQISTGESGQSWVDMRVVWHELEDAISSGDLDRLRNALTEGRRIINRGVGDYRAWDDFIRVSRELTSLKAAERRRLEAHQATLRADQAIALMSALVDSVRRHVLDQKTLLAIQKEWDSILGPVS